mgnify:CR=1 FL=1
MKSQILHSVFYLKKDSLFFQIRFFPKSDQFTVIIAFDYGFPYRIDPLHGIANRSLT